jgi:hypothetical protein
MDSPSTEKSVADYYFGILLGTLSSDFQATKSTDSLLSVNVYASLVLLKRELHLFRERGQQHQYNTRRRDNIDLPYSRLSRAHDCYPMRTLKLYNRLPRHVRELNAPRFERLMRAKLSNIPLYSLREDEVNVFFSSLRDH